MVVCVVLMGIICILCLMAVAWLMDSSEYWKQKFEQSESKRRVEKLRANRRISSLELTVSCLSEKAENLAKENKMCFETVDRLERLMREHNKEEIAKKLEGFKHVDVSVL